MLNTQDGAECQPLTFAQASIEILAGRARAHTLWVLLSTENDRSDFGLKPEVWEGRGEYQRVVHDDGRDVLVCVSSGEYLPHGPAAKATGGAA